MALSNVSDIFVVNLSVFWCIKLVDPPPFFFLNDHKDSTEPKETQSDRNSKLDGELTTSEHNSLSETR